MKKIIILFGILILILILYCNSKKLVINIENARSQELDNFNIIHSQQIIVIPKIKSGELKSITLETKGESSLAINFKVDGVKISKKFDAYFEGGAVGNFHIKVTNDTIVAHEEIYASCILKYFSPNSYILLKEDLRK